MRQPYDFFLPSEEEMTSMYFRLLVLCLCISSATLAQDLLIKFPTGSSELSDVSVDAISSFAKKFPGCRYQIIIQGRTDNVGSVSGNDELSRLRAEAVLAVFILEGKEKSQVSLEWFGENAPLGTNEDELGRSINRSVSITVKEQLCETAAQQEDIEVLYRQLMDQGQQFCIDPDRDTALVGINGTIVYYQPGTFQPAPCSCLRIVLHEFYQPSSMVMNNLTTTSNGKQLESDGMIKLEAWCDNDRLHLEPGKALTVFVPADSLKNGMKLFSANRQQVKEILNWQTVPGELETVDANALRLSCSFGGNYNLGECHLFFCRISRFLTGQGKKDKKADRVNEAIRKEAALVSKYALIETQLTQALEKSKSINKDILKYYVYQNATWDYYNIDRYLPGKNLLDFTVKESYSQGTDIKLVFQKSKRVLPSAGRKIYQFRDVFPDEDTWVIGLKYENGIPYLAMERSNTSSKKCTLHFLPGSIDSIRFALKRID